MTITCYGDGYLIYWFPDQFYRVGREVIKNEVDFLFFFYIEM